MSAPDAVFHVDGDEAVPTELARGPWSPDAQHGGAPAALLAGVLERFDPGPATFPARFTVELLRPVPLAPLRVRAVTVRPGRKVQLVQGTILAGDTEVARATLLRLGEQHVEFSEPPVSAPATPMRPPTGGEPLVGALIARDRGLGFWDAVEMSSSHGEFGAPGPAAMWLRLTVPVVAGEQPSPLQRVAAAADFGNGLSAALSVRRYSCINADVTIVLHRLPEGEWVGLDATTYVEPNGVGMAESVLHDERGRIGRGFQTILVEDRDPD